MARYRAYIQNAMLQTHDCVERGIQLSGRIPDSQSRESGFESPLLPFRSLGIFVLFTTPQSTQLYNEYLAIDSGGHVSE